MRQFQAHILLCLLFVILSLFVLSYHEARWPDYALRDNYYLLFHRAWTLKILSVTVLIGSIHLMFPRLLNLRLDRRFAWIQTGATLIGVLLLLAPSLILLIEPQVSWVAYPDEFSRYAQVSQIGSLIFLLGIAALVFLLAKALLMRRPIVDLDVRNF